MDIFRQRDDKDNYAGPRGKLFMLVEICKGCQSCLKVTPEGGTLEDGGPHVLSMELVGADPQACCGYSV